MFLNCRGEPSNVWFNINKKKNDVLRASSYTKLLSNINTKYFLGNMKGGKKH